MAAQTDFTLTLLKMSSKNLYIAEKLVLLCFRLFSKSNFFSIWNFRYLIFQICPNFSFRKQNIGKTLLQKLRLPLQLSIFEWTGKLCYRSPTRSVLSYTARGLLRVHSSEKYLHCPPAMSAERRHVVSNDALPADHPSHHSKMPQI